MLIILGSLTCQAQKFNILAMSDFLGMTKQELAKLRTVPGFLDWRATPPKNKVTKSGTETEQFVSWGYADGSKMRMLLLDGKTVLAIHAGVSNVFEGAESTLDGNLIPNGYHQWLDGEKNVWELNRSGNIVGLQVRSPFRVPKLPSQARSHPKPSTAARAGTGFWYSAYIGMTVPELSVVFRKTPYAREWNHFTTEQKKNHHEEQVEWTYSDSPSRIMTIFLLNGKATSMGLSDLDAPISKFHSTESLLNRNLRATEANEWVDDARQIEWTLTFAEGSHRKPDRGPYLLFLRESKKNKR